MPIFKFKCARCGQTREEITLSLSEAVPELECCDGVMDRDYSAGQSYQAGYDKPILSDALGLHPSLAEADRIKHPDREYTPNGRLIIRSHQDRERYLREDGFHDNN